jgi:hypothetical protein
VKDSCETDAKKLARCRIWSRFAMPSEGSIAILSGPENGDARHLRARGLDPSRLVCVDAVRANLEKARTVEPRAEYHAADFLETLRTVPCAGFFLDETRIASAEAADYLAACASLVPMGAPIAAAYMYGRWPFAGRAPSWKKNHEHWADFFTAECRRAFGARGLAFDCDTAIGYKGKGVPMLAFVGRVSPAGTWRTPRKFWVVSSPAEARKQVRAWAVREEHGADLLNLAPATLAAWRAVETRKAKNNRAAKTREAMRANAGTKARTKRERYHTDPEYRARELARNRDWREKNKQRRSEYHTVYDAERRERRKIETSAARRGRSVRRPENQSPEARERRREAHRAWVAKNREHRRAYMRALWADKAAKGETWAQRNPERHAEIARKSRAAKKGAA